MAQPSAGLRLALVALLAVQYAAAQALTAGSSQATGWDNLKATLQKFIPGGQKPPTEVAVPTIEWQPVTVMAPTLQVYKMGFCVPRNQWAPQPADAVDCPPQTYMQSMNGQTVCSRTDCAGPVGNNVQPGVQQQKSILGAAIMTALKKSVPQVWGGTAASICSTITVKPIMSCPTNCISDVRQGSDMCLCDAGQMPCPFTYQICTCASFNICVADSYWCDYYCKYAPSWYYALVAKGDKACPIDPNMIDPITPDPIYPGFAAVTGRR